MSTTLDIQDLGTFTKEEATAKLVELRYFRVENRKTGKLTNRRERTIFLHVDVKLPTEGDMYFPGMASVTITHKQAVKFVEDALRHLGERGGKIRMSASARCIFLG